MTDLSELTSIRRQSWNPNYNLNYCHGGIMSTRVPLRPEIVAHEELQRKLKLSTAEIGLQLRTTNCLEEQGIFTVRDLLQSSRERLLSISNFGEKTLNEVYDALERIGFYRKSRQASAPNKVKA